MLTNDGPRSRLSSESRESATTHTLFWKLFSTSAVSQPSQSSQYPSPPSTPNTHSMDAWEPQTLAMLVFGGFMVVSAVGMALVSLVSMRETSYEDALDQQRREINKTQTQRSDRRRKEKTLDKRKTKKRELLEAAGLEPAVASTSEPESDPEPAAGPAVSPLAAEPGLLVDPESVETPPTASQVPPTTYVKAPPMTSVEAPPMPSVEAQQMTSVEAPPMTSVEAAPTSSPKEKKKKKRSGKSEPVSAAETVAKETVMIAVEAAVVAKETVAMGSAPSDPASVMGEKPKMDMPAKKAKAGPEPPPVQLRYKTLLSSITEAVLSQKEVQKLIQALQQKTSGEPDVVAALKKKLEEKEKQLNNEKKDTSAAKARLRDLTQEVSAERSKMRSLEAGLRAELLASGHAQATLTQQLQLKVSSLQEQLENGPSGQLTRLTQENSILRDALNQATSQAESRQNAELARLRQEVLRGAREVGELSRKKDALQSSEERRRSLENKLSSMEQQLAQTQLTHVEKERDHQQRQKEMQEELGRCGDVIASLQESLTQAQQHEVTIAELRGSLGSAQEELEALKARLEQPEPQVGASSKMEELSTRLQEREQQVTSLEEEVQHLKKNLENIPSASLSSNGVKESEGMTTSDSQTQEDTTMPTSRRITELEAVLEERERQVVTLETELGKLKEEMETLKIKVHDSGSETESEQPFESLEKDSQLLALEEELTTTRENLEQMKQKNNELREKNWTAVEALAAAEKMNLQRLTEAQRAVVVAEDSASHLQTEVQKCLKLLFPEVSVEPQQQGDWLELVTQKALETQRDAMQTSQEVLTKLKENERILQAECETNRNILVKAKGELLSVQSRAEEQERVWKEQWALADQQRQEAQEESLVLVNSESENKQLREQLMLLEAQLEKQLESSHFTQTNTEEMAQAQQPTADLQLQVEKMEAEQILSADLQEEQEQTSSKTPQEQTSSQTSQDQLPPQDGTSV